MCWNRWTFEATPDAWRLAWHSEADEPLALGGHGALDELEVVEGDAGAHGDAFEGVVGDVAGDADLLGDQAVEVAEEGGAAREDDAAVDDVGGELGRGALEDGADGADDRLEGVGDAGADGGGQRFGDDVGGTAGTGGLSGVLDGALLDAGDAGGHADHDLGPDEGDAADDAGDEVAEHGLGGDVVGDDALAHRADDLDGAGGAAEHVARFLADGDDGVVALGDGDDGGLVDDDAAALDVDEAVGGAEVYADALTEHGYSESPRSPPRQPGRINPPR